MFQDYISEICFDVIPFGGFVVPSQNADGEEVGKICSNGTKEHECEGVSTKTKIKIKVENLNLSWSDKNISDKQPPKKMATGGGEQLKITKKNINPQLREYLEKLAESKTFKKQNGEANWDGIKLAKNLTSYQFGKIEISKHSWRPKFVYFFVDTSGSVYHLADLIIKLITSTTESRNIRVFSGSEAHPNKNESENIILSSNRKRWLDESMIDLFKIEKPEKDSILVFWGDLQMAGIRSELREVLRNYTTFWFNPSPNNCTWDESVEMRKIAPVFMEMNNEIKIINKLKQII